MSTDLEHLLRDAAPIPNDEPDFSALYRRGVRERRVRAGLWVGGAVASVASIVGLSSIALPQPPAPPTVADTSHRPLEVADESTDRWLVARDGQTITAADVASLEGSPLEPVIAGGWDQEVADAIEWQPYDPELPGTGADAWARPVVGADGVTLFIGSRGAVLVDHQHQQVVGHDLTEIDARWWEAGRWVVVGSQGDGRWLAQILAADGEIATSTVLPQLPNGRDIALVVVRDDPGMSPAITAYEHGDHGLADGHIAWQLSPAELEEGAASWEPVTELPDASNGWTFDHDLAGRQRLDLPGGGHAELDLEDVPGGYELEIIVLDQEETYRDGASTPGGTQGGDPARFLVVVDADTVALTRVPSSGVVLLGPNGSLWLASATDEGFSVAPLAR